MYGWLLQRLLNSTFTTQKNSDGEEIPRADLPHV